MMNPIVASSDTIHIVSSGSTHVRDNNDMFDDDDYGSDNDMYDDDHDHNDHY